MTAIPPKESLFKKALKPRFSYKVEVEVLISDGTKGKLIKYVKAWSKKRAEKLAITACLKDVRFVTGKINRIARRVKGQ